MPQNASCLKRNVVTFCPTSFVRVSSSVCEGHSRHECGECSSVVLVDTACSCRPLNWSHDVPASIFVSYFRWPISRLFCSNSLPNICFTLCLTLSHPCMYIHEYFQESPAPDFLCGCCLLFFGFVLAPFQETLPNAAQADLCISCMNGGSTRAKNFENSFHKQASKRSTLFNLW